MKRFFQIFALLLLLVIACFLAGKIYLLHWAAQPLNISQEQVINVPTGSSLYQISAELEADGIITSARLLRIYGRLQPENGHIQAGDYQLVPAMTVAELLQDMATGAVLQYTVTLVDGQTFASFKEALRQTPNLQYTLDGQDIGDLLSDWGSEQRFPEGLFFPDTYIFHGGDTDVSILQRSFQRMQQQLQIEWEQRANDLPYRTSYEALIMASIVDKETGVPEERAEIAGVFVNRLKKNMRLQTDPTVIYGLGDRYKGNLKKSHLNEYTPYNTYRIEGLPPTPIANPGLAAIKAALHPSATPALYFVAKGDGSHHFSVTLAEHEEAVKMYQFKRRSDYRSSPK